MKNLNIHRFRIYKNRYRRPFNPVMAIKFYAFWLSVLVLILYIIPDRAWDLKMGGFFTIVFIGAWRYSWQILNFVQSIIYEVYYYPKLKAKASKVRHPKRVFFIVLSYKEDPKVSRASFRYLIEECYKIDSDVYIYASVGSKEEAQLISKIVDIYDVRRKIKLTVLYQKQGKRVAIFHALRAVAREFYNPSSFHKDAYNDVLILMDGDTVLGKDCLKGTVPFFVAYKNLGAVTTDEEVYYHGDNKVVGMWYRLKFAKRDIMMKSHSLHRRVLTLTGRFSAFRAQILLKEEFINMMAKDNLDHWLFGRFRFLMGDDKTTWFYLLKNGWDMLYIPDVWIFSVESRGGNFINVSTSLMVRWYGNMLRNNWRALRLGPKRVGGWFIWYAILDQRISMWTSLVGPTIATLFSIFVSPFFWLFYIAWVIFVRMIQMLFIVKERVAPYIIDMLLILYDQWWGSILKIYASHNLAKQKWSKGSSQKVDMVIKSYLPLRRALPMFIMFLSALLYIILMGVYSGIFKLPDIRFLIFSKANASELQDYSDSIQRKINTEGYVELPSGVLNVYKPILINRDNITVKGKDTTIVSYIKSPYKGVFVIEGREPQTIAKVKEYTPEGSTDISVIFTKNVCPEYVWVGSPNSEEFLKKIGSQRWFKEYPYVRQDIVRVKRCERDRILLSSPLEFDVEQGSPVKSPNFVSNIKIENIKIVQAVEGYSKKDVEFVYQNLFPDYSVDGIYLNWVKDSVLQNITVEIAGRHPVNLENSKNVKIFNLRVYGAWNKGDKGNGYIRFARTYDSTIDGCHIEGIRHLTFQWSSSRNIVRNCFLKVDVNFHGGFERYNKVVDSKIQIPSKHPWSAVERTPQDAHWAPPSGPGNTVERVYIEN